MASDFFDQVDFVGAVGAPRRHFHTQPGASGNERAFLYDNLFRRTYETNTGEQRRHLAHIECRAQHSVHLCHAQRDGGGLGQVLGLGVTRPCVHHQLGARLAQNSGKSRHRVRHPMRVDTALEACRGFGTQRQALTGEANTVGGKPSRLECDLGGAAADLGVLATHDPSNAYRPIVAVTNQQVGRVKGTIHTIKGD